MFNFLDLIQLALKEDLEPLGDLTTNALFDDSQRGKLKVKARGSAGLMSGSVYASQVFKVLDDQVRVKFNFKDGENFVPESALVELEGHVKSLLIGERLFLNLLQRAISIASLTRKYVELISGTGCKVLETRKTSPGLRLLEKQAVLDGGGSNHRFNLATGILIKDNHIALQGGDILATIKKAKARLPLLTKIEIEVDTLEQFELALRAGVDVILLDNFSLGDLSEAVKMAKSSKVMLEASGGVNCDNARAVAETGVDFISVGALTQNVTMIDLGMDFED